MSITMDNFTPSINSDDFPYFLRFLEDVDCFSVNEIINVVEKPYHFSEHYKRYKNSVDVEYSNNSVLEGYESDCCLDKVVKLGDDLVCTNCFKDCENWCLNEND